MAYGKFVLVEQMHTRSTSITLLVLQGASGRTRLSTRTYNRRILVLVLQVPSRKADAEQAAHDCKRLKTLLRC